MLNPNLFPIINLPIPKEEPPQPNVIGRIIKGKRIIKWNVMTNNKLEQYVIHK